MVSDGFLLVVFSEPGFGCDGSRGAQADEEAIVAKDQEGSVALERSVEFVRRHDSTRTLDWFVGGDELRLVVWA
jgi:hypothetical protein